MVISFHGKNKIELEKKQLESNMMAMKLEEINKNTSIPNQAKYYNPKANSNCTTPGGILSVKNVNQIERVIENVNNDDSIGNGEEEGKMQCEGESNAKKIKFDSIGSEALYNYHGDVDGEKQTSFEQRPGGGDAIGAGATEGEKQTQHHTRAKRTGKLTI